jgi:hypothetical protein
MKENEDSKNVIPWAEDPQEGECFGTRPRRKPDISKHGKLLGWPEEGYFLFAEKESRPDLKREVIHKGQNVSVTKTAGEKESSVIVSAKVDASLPDPIGTAMTMIAKELKDKVKKEPKFNPSTFLFESDELKVWQNVPQRKLHVHIALDVKSPQLMLMQLQELQTDIYKTINKSFLYK